MKSPMDTIYTLKGKEFPMKRQLATDGKTITIEDLKGKPTLLCFWFIRCAGCVAEFPDLNKLKAKFGDQVNFVSVTFDKSLKVQEFLKKKPLDFITVTDATDITDGIGLTSYPTTIFLDKDGRVASVQNNMSEGDKPQPEHPGKESFESILKKLL